MKRDINGKIYLFMTKFIVSFIVLCRFFIVLEAIYNIVFIEPRYEA